MDLAQRFVQGDYDEARAALEVMYQMGIVEGERRSAARLAVLPTQRGPDVAPYVLHAV